MKKTLTTIIGLLLLGAPLLSSAVDLTDDTPSGSDALYCPSLTLTLKRGARDVTTAGQVSELQNFLADYFDLNERDVVSGYFGRLTQQYLTRFQAANDLPAYGIAGLLTRQKIQEVCQRGGRVIDQACTNVIYSQPVCPAGQVPQQTMNGVCPGPWRCSGSTNPPVVVSPSETKVSSVWMKSDTLGLTDVPYFFVKATRTVNQDYGAASPSEGYKVLVRVQKDGAYIGSFNPSYNTSSGYWEGSLGLPMQNTGVYQVTTELYCTNTSLPCSRFVGVTLDKVLSSFDSKFSVGNVSCAQPHITTPAAGYSLGINPIQSGTGGQMLMADQPVTFSLVNSPAWGSIAHDQRGDLLIFPSTIPSQETSYDFTIVAKNSCGNSDTRTIKVVVSNGTATIQGATSSTATPTISGTAANVGALGLSISNAGGKVYGSGLIGNSGGYWSHTVTTSLPTGTYTVEVYNYYSNARLATGTMTVSSPGNTPYTGTCQVVYMQAPQVPGSVAYNFILGVKGLPGGSGAVAITGADSWNGLTFHAQGFDKDGYYLLQADQTLNATAVNYMLARKSTVAPVSYGGVPVRCLPIDGGVTSSDIKVTAPNGGERWEIDTMNTVTWAPYSYNPDMNPSRDVTAYLEKKNTDGSFTTLGKVQESGKASIHWYAGELNAATGPYGKVPAGDGYYIRVVNNVTGASDRSDAPFSLVPKSVDLKINGSDGPAFNGSFIYVTMNDPIIASWSVSGGRDCKLFGVAEVPGRNANDGPSYISITGATGSRTVYPVKVPAMNGNQESIINGIQLSCTNSVGAQTTDYVQIDLRQPLSPASLQITSPNGGELIQANETTQVKVAWRMEGVSTPLSVALYKDDKWLMWLEKSLYLDKSLDGTYSYVWTPNAKGPVLPPLASGVNSGYKIYITAPRADGTGFIDDKSDAPFSLVASGSPSLKASVTPSSVQNGAGVVTIKWDIDNAPPGAALEIGASDPELNAGGDATFPFRNVMSPYVLDGSTATLDAASASWNTRNSIPSHGTMTWTPGYAPGYLPITGPMNFTMIDSQGKIIAQTSVPFTVAAPAASREVQVVGVYTGLPHSTNHSEATVNVTVTGTTSPAPVLVLSAYEPTHWVINNQANATFEKIVTLGYYDQRVDGAPAGTTIESHTWAKDGNYAWSCAYANYETNGGCSYASLKTWLEARGMPITTFTGQYEGGAFNVYLGAKGMVRPQTQVASPAAASPYESYMWIVDALKKLAQ